MGLTDVGPPKVEIISNDEESVRKYADMVRDEAGKLIVSANESVGEKPDGKRIVTVEKDSEVLTDGSIETVRVKSEPSVLSRLRRDRVGSEHMVRRYPNGVIEYSTTRNSALGGTVTKTMRVTKVDGIDHVSYEIIRRDARGDIMPRKGRTISTTDKGGVEESVQPTRSRGSISSLAATRGEREQEKDARRRRERVIRPADAIRDRVMGAIAGYSPVEPKKGNKETDKDKRPKMVTQVPSKVKKYQSRVSEENAASEELDRI
ncbi:MAG: hypothetical protein H6799_01590 [Candidatus Nomurabacteria bacterium]|nr:MAG: hypothetical protein H6799_01590 [Candidatus Nomurabacteria bacterium]HRV75768.1 hypothetical protein [Candidatus Saccharimonadales bacterium]